MIGGYLTDTAVLIKKPATDVFGSETAPAEEITIDVLIEYGTRMVVDRAGNEVLSSARVSMRDRAISHEDRLRFDDIDHGIKAIEKPKAFGQRHVKVFVA